MNFITRVYLPFYIMSIHSLRINIRDINKLLKLEKNNNKISKLEIIKKEIQSLIKML